MGVIYVGLAADDYVHIVLLFRRDRMSTERAKQPQLGLFQLFFSLHETQRPILKKTGRYVYTYLNTRDGRKLKQSRW
jgi:hypothetical protein